MSRIHSLSIPILPSLLVCCQHTLKIFHLRFISVRCPGTLKMIGAIVYELRAISSDSLPLCHDRAAAKMACDGTK